MTVTPTRLVTLTISYNGSTGYCLSAKHANGSTTWYYDSLGGGIQPKGSTGCPVGHAEGHPAVHAHRMRSMQRC